MDGDRLMSQASPLVSADWLRTNISAPDIRIVDATWELPFLVARQSGRTQYDSGHIPGAVFFDIDDVADQESPLPHMLPDAVQFSSKVRKLGLGDGNHIVIYDSNNFFASARVWWMFRAMGHRDVSVLNGGYKAWLSAGGEIEDLPPRVSERHYTARQRADLIRSKDQVLAASRNAREVILDARSPGRFAGTEPEPREGLPSGHIPGSVCVPASSLIDPSGRMESPEALSRLLADFLDQPVIATCGSGVSAAIIALALAHLGHWETAIYDGSWTEWASGPDNPIARR